MADHNQHEDVELLDETGQILHSLAQLIQTTSNPIVKVCLEEAYEDIAHLTYTGGESEAASEAA